MTIERDEKGRGQDPFIYTKKKKAGFLNIYKTYAYAVT